MATISGAIEATGIIDDKGVLQLETLLPTNAPTRVRVLILFPQEQEDDDDADETEWLKTASTNSAFDFLKDSEEDVRPPIRVLQTSQSSYPCRSIMDKVSSPKCLMSHVRSSMTSSAAAYRPIIHYFEQNSR